MAEECANPLLAQFLKEWWDVAKERNSKGATTFDHEYKRAYESMIACPLTFSHPSEAQQLHGVGSKLCDRLYEELKKHCEKNGLPLPKKSRKRQSLEGLETPSQEAPQPKKPRKAKPYVPKLQTGPYAILMALSSLDKDAEQRLSKAEICLLAQEHCEASFTAPSEPGKFYTAWNSMKTLEDKDLVYSKGRPQRKYQLTEEGWEVARRIRKVNTAGGAVAPNDIGSKEKDSSPKAKVTASKSNASKSKPVVGYLDLEDDSDDLDDVPAPKGRTFQDVPHPSSSIGTGEAGQRLGGAPLDKFGTYNPRKERPKAPNREIVDLDSSPDPEPGPKPANTSWSFDRIAETPSESNAKLKSLLPSTESAQLTRPLKESFPTFEPIVLQPGTFTVQLILDSREVRAKDDRDYIAKELSKKGIIPTTRALELGDFFWVAKTNDSTLLSHHSETGSEIALDHIIERKRLDDLIASIKDRRFHEQKFRLRRSGIKNVTYLIEDITLSAEHATRYHDMMETAVGETQILNGYFVKRTAGLDATIRYLARLTRLLKTIYEAKPLYVIPTKHLDAQTYLPFMTHLRATQPHVSYNITYPSFASLASKSDSTTLRDVYLKMLMCTRGLSGEKAIEVQKIWATPRGLIEALGMGGGGEGLLEGRLGRHPVGRKKIGKALSKKVAGVWGVG
ncbi:MAG: hypothetical protein Q9195_009601 [Heterodermia aff. obscurata]